MGRFEAAHRGTLFLDEVGEIPPELQGKLLRALQQQSFERVGDEKTRQVDVRVIAATNRQLADDVAQNRFRRDLYYRLSTFSIDVPPLRDRAEDVVRLAESFVAQLRRRYRGVNPDMTARHQSMLLAYDWPGNVRELKNAVERAFVLGQASGRLDFERALAGLNVVPKTREAPQGGQNGRRGHFTAKEFEEFERDNLIAAMARDLLGRVQGDPQIGRFWINRSNSDLQREEQMLTRYLCAALGGPRDYRGETMIDVHRGLGITPSDWNVLRRHMAAMLQAFDIDAAYQAQLTAMVEDLRPQIVGAG